MADEIKKIEDKKNVAEKINKTADEIKTTDAPINKEPQAIIQDKKEEAKKPEVKKFEEIKGEVVSKKPQGVLRKDEAVARGINLHASMKQCMYINSFIKGKSIDEAIKDLEDVIIYKKVIPFKGEIPHRKGNIMSGRWPINACKIFIPILKTLKGNVLVNKIDLDKTKIYFASVCYASRSSKKGGGRFKRANLVLKAKGAGK